jgi:hypothetical protein
MHVICTHPSLIYPSIKDIGEEKFKNLDPRYVINFSELAMANDRLLYRMNIALYSFILKLVPSIILTVITGFLSNHFMIILTLTTNYKLLTTNY